MVGLRYAVFHHLHQLQPAIVKVYSSFEQLFNGVAGKVNPIWKPEGEPPSLRPRARRISIQTVRVAYRYSSLVSDFI